jgi:hypothetical protein
MDEIRAATGVGDLADVNQRCQLVFLGIDHGDLVRRIGGDHEIAPGRVEAPVMQESRGVDRW